MQEKKIRTLILGATGLIGSGLFMNLAGKLDLDVLGTIRNPQSSIYFPPELRKNLFSGIDVTNGACLLDLISHLKPDVVINSIGITKHLSGGDDPLVAIPLNAYLPHYLAAHCRQLGARLIHISSDCVFSGSKGGYLESDIPDARDIYGQSKALGEIDDGVAITLRTSTIGHELITSYGLLNWFLNQNESCLGYKRALFSGVPTVELGRIIYEYVLPAPNLSGIYQIVGPIISKYDLLSLIAKAYGKKIKVIPESHFVINRSMNGQKFFEATGYIPQSWPNLIKMMHQSK